MSIAAAVDWSNREGFIWSDGGLKPWKEATSHVLGYSLHYGVGCFEGIRAYATPRGTAVFRLEEHTRRLFNSAAILGIRIPFTPEQINAATLEVLRANQLDEAYIRPLVYYGAEGLGLRGDKRRAQVIIAAWSWGAYLGADNAERGIRVRTSSYVRHHVNAAACRAKAVSGYQNSVLALDEALADGYDEAVMLDPQGFIAEGSAENIFLVQDGALHTPDITSALDGITRRTVMRLAQDAGIEVHQRRLTRDELYISDEAFFTGTAAEVVPIREADRRTIGSGQRGPVTGLLQSAYASLVRGGSDRHGQWLTYL